MNEKRNVKAGVVLYGAQLLNVLSGMYAASQYDILSFYKLRDALSWEIC